MGEEGGCSSRRGGRMDRESRGRALEKTHVHDVYDQMAHHFCGVRHKAWPKVKHFLQDLEPGSLVADIGELTQVTC